MKQSSTVNLQLQITLPVTLLFIVVFIIMGYVTAGKESAHFEQAAIAEAQAHANQLAGAFKYYGAVAKTYATAPMLTQWFAQHQERGADLSDDPQYQMVNQSFIAVSQSDDNIYSVFFATEKTAEYFRENEITGAEHNYYTTKRPWYIQAVKTDGFILGRPSVDYTTGSVSTVIQSPVKDDEGELLGVAGIDLRLNGLLASLERSYGHSNGFVILLDDINRLVYLPKQLTTDNFKITTAQIDYDGNQLRDERGNVIMETTTPRVGHPIHDLDSHPQTDGFAQLALEKIPSEGVTEVTFAGKPYNLAQADINLDMPKAHWRVLFVQPKAVFDNKILQSRIHLVLLGIILALMVAIAVHIVGRRQIQ